MSSVFNNMGVKERSEMPCTSREITVVDIIKVALFCDIDSDDTVSCYIQSVLIYK